MSREVKKALQVQRSRPGLRVVQVLLPGMTPKALRLWFKKEPLAVEIGEGPLGLIMAMPKLLSALGVREPTDDEPLDTPAAPPVAELVLRLSDPRILAEKGTRRAAATARLVYNPPDGGEDVESERFAFTAPLGPIEADDPTWYLERYYLWPIGVFRERAEGVDAELPGWGGKLYEAAVGHDCCRGPRRRPCLGRPPDHGRHDARRRRLPPLSARAPARLRVPAGGRHPRRPDGALAEQVAVPATSLHTLPDGVDPVFGALVEPGDNTLRAVQAAALRSGDRVLVLLALKDVTAVGILSASPGLEGDHRGQLHPPGRPPPARRGDHRARPGGGRARRGASRVGRPRAEDPRQPAAPLKTSATTTIVSP